MKAAQIKAAHIKAAHIKAVGDMNMHALRQ